MPTRTYGGLIWTNHALERLSDRRLSQELAIRAFRHPDRVISGKIPGSKEYQKQYEQSVVTVIAKQNETREWIVLSCWIDPPLSGTKDERKQKLWREYRRASWWGKWWVVVKKTLGFF